MNLVKVKGIVVGEQDYKETSKILKIFTENQGIISVLSKGCKKPKSPLKEASNNLIYANFDISYKKDGLSTLVGVDIIEIFKNILMDYKDLAKKMYAFTIVDLSIQLLNQKQIEENEINEVYNLMLSSIKKINEGLNPEILLDIIMLKYLNYLGVAPSFDSCSNCGNNENIITMDSNSYGFICKECYKDEKMVNEKSLKLIRMLYYVDIDRIKNLEVGDEYNDVHDFISSYYEDHTGVYFNIKKKIQTLNKMKGIM